MQEATTPLPQQPANDNDTASRVQPEVDERDETIRLLNAALSEALDELECLTDEQAA
jgi:hypothetical protein